ncbi:MAG: GNAT family N-acetyltransferase [Clostridiales bacterium]|nr:GNAT family N-acetyltransferase [Clostridiales bacterium]
MITIELLTERNFNLNSLDEYERRHEVTKVYRKQNSEYVLVERPYIEDWSIDERRQIATKMSSDDYVSYIALENKKVAGFIALKKSLIDNYMILDEMHVGSHYRGQGLGRKLFALGIEEAKRAGAEALYISACSSEETIAFYKAMGAILTSNPIKEMAEKEPYDLQMVCEV